MKDAIVIERADLEKVAEKFLQEMALSHRFVVEKPMTKTEVAKFLSYSVRAVDKLVESGIIKPHRFIEGGSPRFLPSEILEELRRR